MIANGVFFLVLLSGSVFCAVRCGRKFEEMLPITCMGIVLTLFLFGCVGRLVYGVAFVILAAIGLYGYSGVKIVRGEGEAFAQNFLTPAFALFCIFFVVLNVCDFGLGPSSFDEFSHWMDCGKVMVHLDDFAANPASNSLFPSYPPGMVLFQYFFQKLYLFLNPDQVFSEWRMYLGYQVFLLSLMFPFLTQLSYKRPGLIVLGGTILFTVVLPFFPYVYSCTYIDAFVGALAGCGFLMVLLQKKGDFFSAAYTTLACSLLVLAKDVGMYFACLISVAFFWNIGEVQNIKAKPALARNIWTNRIVALAPMAGLLATKAAWKLVLYRYHTKISFGGKIDLLYYTKMFFLRNGETDQQTIVENFKKNFFSKLFCIGDTKIIITYFLLLAFTLLLLYLLCTKLMSYQPTRAASIKATGTIIAIQLPIYIFCLGATYVSNFSVVEGIALASYGRYMNIAFLSVWVVLILGTFYIIQEYTDGSSKTGMALFLTVGLLTLSPMEETAAFLNRDKVSDAQFARQKYAHMAEMIHKHCDTDDRICYITQNYGTDEHAAYLISKYYARPSTLVLKRIRMGESPDGSQNETANTADEWLQELKQNYDYVVIYHATEDFIENYGEVFENPGGIGDNTLYRVPAKGELLQKCE